MRRLTIIGWMPLVLCCTDERAGEVDVPRLLAASFATEFRVGDNPSERQFSKISSMAFGADGRLAVVDRGEFAVTVFDPNGRETARWGAKGDGPGEFQSAPGAVAVSDEATVAVQSFRRVDVFTLDGQIIGSHLLDTLSASAITFDREGKVVAHMKATAAGSRATEARSDHIMRLATRQVLWSSRPLPPRGLFALWPQHVRMAGIGQNRVVVGMSDEYSLAILDATTGRERGRIARNVPLRGPSEEFQDNLHQTLGGMAEGDGDPLLAAAVEQIDLPETFRVIAGVFVGPPARTIWVRRGMGLGDSLAPPIEDMNEGVFRLYDLFDGDGNEYFGTVEIPEHLELLTGDATRVAGVHTDELGVHSVRVLKVTFRRQD